MLVYQRVPRQSHFENHYGFAWFGEICLEKLTEALDFHRKSCTDVLPGLVNDKTERTGKIHHFIAG